MEGWEQDLWLVAISADVPADEIKRWWTAKDAPALETLAEAAPRVRLGTLVTIGEDPDLPGPTRRLVDLLFLRGTLPAGGGTHVLPRLDAELRSALLAAFTPRADDHPIMESAPLTALTDFLDEHANGEHGGTQLITDSTTAVRTVDVEPARTVAAPPGGAATSTPATPL